MAGSPRSRLHLLLGAGFAAVAATGLVLWPATLWTPGYFPVLGAHVVLGLALLGAAPFALAVHLKQTSSPSRRSILPVIGLLVIPNVLAQFAILGDVVGRDDEGRGWLAGLFAKVSVWLWGVDGGDGGAIAEASLVAMVLVGLAVLVARRIRAREPSVPVRWTGVLVTAVVFATLTTGLLGYVQRGDARFDAYAGHSLLGLISLVLAVAHLKAPRRVLGPRLGPVVLVGAIVATAALWLPSYEDEHLAGFRADGVSDGWSTRTLHDLRGDDGAPFDAALLGGSATCGSAGCHEALTRQWSGSTHRFAADNDLYGATVAQLVRERGAGEVRFCAGCHDPERALTDTVEEAYADGAPPPGEGVSCVVCHLVVDHPDDVANGRAVYREPVPYPGRDEATRARRIKLDPRYHRQTFAADVTVSAKLCGSCHRVKLSPAMGAAIEGVVQDPFDPEGSLQCDRCHMPTNTRVGIGMTRLYDHAMPGINLDLARYTHAPVADAPALEEVRQEVEALAFGDGEGVLDVEVEGVRRGDVLTVRVTSTNRRVGHAFPLGPFDLREVWQVVVARDASGAVVWQRGEVGDDGRPDPEAPRLGAVELDRAGEPLQKHRIWDVAGVRDLRVVEPTESVVDEHRIEAPGPLRIEVQWRLRRTNRAYARWVYGPTHPGFEAHVVASGTWSEGG